MLNKMLPKLIEELEEIWGKMIVEWDKTEVNLEELATNRIQQK